MATINEDVLIRFKGQDDTGSALNSVKSRIQSLQKENQKLTKQSITATNTMGKRMNLQNQDRYSILQNKEYQNWLNTQDNLTKKMTKNSQQISKLKQQEANAVTKANNQISQSYQRMGGVVSSAMGMLGGMIGYELVNGLVTAGREAINASQQFDYFAGRLGKSKGETEAFRNEVKSMQKDFKKVNMESIGSTAMDIALRNGMQGTNEELSEITKMSAVMASEFKRNGRTEEDSIMAVNDALDGQFRRLQEIGISQEDLKNNGWNGDVNDKIGLVKALNKTMSEMGYDKTAQDITNLDDAWAALTVSGGNLLKEVLIPMMPAFLSIIDGLTDLASGFGSMPQEWKNFISYAIAGTAALVVFGKAVGSIRGALGGLKGFSGLFGKIFGSGAGGAGGAAGGEATGKGIVATLKGLKGFGRALLGLVPDIIMAAAAVAVIIAVIFALAAEVIVLTKGIQMLIDAMDFGGIDLKDDIEGLKKLKEAMWEIAQIMGAMAIANVANVVTQFTGGVLNLAVSLKTIKDAYKKVADALKDIAGMEDINQTGLDKLKKISEALKAVGDSMGALNQLSGGMNINNAINGFVAWLTGGEADPVKNIDTVITKIKEIAPKLDGLKNLPDIDASGVEKIRKVGDAMKSLSDAMNGMQGFSAGVGGAIMDWWNGDLSAQVDKAITQINQVGSKLQGIGTYTIPDLTWIQRATTGMQYLKSAMDVMNTYAGMQINTEVPELIGRAVTAVKMVAQQLQGLQGTDIGDINTILSNIQNAINNIKATLAAANFTAEGTNIGTSLVTGVQTGLSGMNGVVSNASNQAIDTMRGIIPPGAGAVAQEAVTSFQSGLNGMAAAVSTEMQNVVNAFNNSKGAVAAAAKGVGDAALQAFKSAYNPGSPGDYSKAIDAEMGYVNQSILNSNSMLSSSMYRLGSNMLNAFKRSDYSGLNTQYTKTGSESNVGNTYYIGEGAFSIHVSDMTDQECKSVIVQALESL